MELNQNKQVQEYINSVCSHIKNRKVHEEIRTELFGHIEEVALELLSSGSTEADAVEKAVSRMGDAQFVGRQLNKIHRVRPEWSILTITILLASLGLCAMYFIQTNGVLRQNYQIFGRSLFSTSLGLALACGLYFFDYRKMRALSKYIYIGTFLLLLFVTNAGIQVNGVKAWIAVGPFTVNFVYISPYLFIIALAGLFDGWNWNEPKKIWLGLSLSAAPAIVLLTAPSLSAVVTYSIAIGTLMLVSGIKLKHVLLIIGSCFGVLLYGGFTSVYRMKRFLTFINPGKDPQGGGWLYIQLNKATHSAGLLGQGFTLDSGVIPEIHTEFVFTYIVYTFGWIAGVTLAALIILFLIRMTKTAAIIKNNYGKLITSGFTVIFAVQFLWNILMNIGLAPISGVALPFISFGGSQFVISMAAVGVILNIYKFKNASIIPGGNKGM